MTGVVCQWCGAPVRPDARFCMQCGERIEQTEWQGTVPERLAAALGPQFSIVGELGRGGFAAVYSVRDQRRGRYLAVKVMRPSLVPSGRMRERFRREAQFVSQLDHPNILPILFTGKDAGLVYFAMPRVRGLTLRERLAAEGPLPVEEAARIVREVGAALDHAHRRGVVHRDVKPGNIMLDPRRNRVLVLDFGIAKALSQGNTSISVTGEVVGSPEYMSPEQATAGGDIDQRSDIYSLGIVAYEMLSGEAPFTGEHFQEILAHHVSTPPPDLHRRRSDVPEGFAEMIARCLEKRPVDRWSSVGEAAARVAS